MEQMCKLSSRCPGFNRHFPLSALGVEDPEFDSRLRHGDFSG